MKTLRVVFFITFCFLTGSASYAQTNFKATPTQGCVPLNVNFTDLSTGAVRWDWDFGNGNRSTLQNPSAIYYAGGKYTVTLTTWDASGNKTSITKSNVVRAFKNPTANFSASPLVVCVGSKVTFTSSSTPGDTGIVKYSWDMGDGTLLNQVTPGHAFKSAGLFNISLVVIDGHGCQDKILKNSYIRVKPAPTASFISDSTFNCTAPSAVQFSDRSKGGSLTYSWDFGDGNTSNQKNPRHTYKALGTYSPKLTVTDTNGCSSTYNATNSVYLGPLTADFTASKTTMCGKGTVDFNLIGKLVSAAKYEWDFGDGNKVTKASPSHTYTKTGTYTVTLTAIAIYRSCTTVVEKKNLIRVFPTPKGKISVSDSFPCKPPFTLKLTYTDAIPFRSVNWIYYNSEGDRFTSGSGSSINEFVYDYEGRNYKAIVTTLDGCTDSIELDWEVKSDSVVANFSGDTAGCKPILGEFTDQSVSDYKVKYWEWTFHNGSKSYNSSANFFYMDTGHFPVKLYVKTEHDCEDSVVKMVHTGLKTTPTYYMITKKEICNNSDTVRFRNTTKYPGFNIDSFKWVSDVPDGNIYKRIPVTQTSYKSTNIALIYDRDTGYITTMLISYHNGCPDTMEKKDSIYMKPPYAKIETRSDYCGGNKLIVLNKSTLFTRHEWQIDKTIYKDDSLVLNSGGVYHIILRVWNDTAGCYDTVFYDHTPPLNKLDLCTPQLSSTCTPATLRSCVASEIVAPGSYWTLNETDTVWSANQVQYKLDTAGTYRLVFHYKRGANCFDLYGNSVKVYNGDIRGSITYPTACLPATIKLIDSSWTPGGAKHAWRMSNGDVVLATSMSMDYVVQNSYSDTLEIKLTNEPEVGLCKPFKAFYIPTSGPGVRLSHAWQNTCSTSTFVANADVNPNKGAQPFTFAWNMGDGSTFNSQFVSYKFKDTGWYNVSITVTDANGCKATDIKKIYIPEFRLDIKINSDTSGAGCPPLYVNFKDISTAGGTAIKSWEWDFGDGSYSTQKNPQHQYLIPGRFTVKLKITDALGCTRTKIFPDFIVISGPYGVYKFDNTEGCYPLVVQFSDSLSENTFKSEWDFGDGVVGTQRSPKHIYNKPGRFIPSVILSDSLGCKISLPPVDTIYIYDYPQANFSFNGICLRDTVKMQSTSFTRDEPIMLWRWDIEDNRDMVGEKLDYLFTTRNTMVRHIVTTIKGCSDTLDLPVPLKQPVVNYTSAKDTVCLGNIWQGYGTYKLDTTLESKAWYLDNAFYSDKDDVLFKATKSGQYRFRFMVADAAGCWDTFSKPHAVSFGDTVTPPIVPLLRVSVENDISHDIKFRKFPTFDFSGYTIYRDQNGSFEPVLNISGRNDTLHYLYGVDALHESYCYRVSTKNLCEFTQDVKVLQTHCTVEVGGQPAINASLLDWNAYAGWPVQRYEVYREDHKNPGSYLNIGTVNGETLSYIDSSIVCYVNHTYRIKAYEDGGNNEVSWSDTCHVKPIYINVVPTPEIRRATVVDDRFVRIEWDEMQKNRQPIDFFEIEKQDAAAAYRWLFSAPVSDTFVYHDHKTKVDDASYVYHLRAVDVCGDKSAFSNIGKSILLQTDINPQYRPELHWTKYQEWKEGVKEYVIEKKNGNGDFTEVARTTSADDTTYVDNLSSLNCIPLFEYRVYAIRNAPVGLPAGIGEIRSYSNVDAPPVVTKVFIPNAFTPNANGLNEVFKPQGIYVASYTMKIYNRWGEKVYEGSECENSWDGMYNGDQAPHGVYIYIVDAKGSDGRRYHFRGDVTLLR